MGTIGSQMSSSALAQAYGHYNSRVKYKLSYLVNLHGASQGEQSLRIYDIFSKKLTIVPLNFVPHTITRISEEILVCTMKHGPYAAIIDIKKGKVIHSHNYSDNDQMQYTGHCLFNQAKGVVYTTEQINSQQVMNNFRNGVVNERDPFTWKILNTYESYGSSPHDLTFTQSGLIAICNSSADQSFNKGGSFWKTENRNIALVDPQGFSLVKRIAMPNTYFCPGHIKPFADSLVATGVYGHLSDLEFHWAEVNWNPIVIDKNGNVSELKQDPYVKNLMNTEHLSIAVNENHGVVAVTIPYCDSVNFWSLKDQRFLAHLNFILPKGILVHPQTGEFVVITDKGAYSVNPTNFKEKSLGMHFLGNDMAHSYIV
jgi:hypothetical protein